MTASVKIWFETSPVSALRDLVLKRPSLGPNIKCLDGVRGLAVLIVMASHTDAFHLRGQGGVGVWLFFCLSGFLLTIPFARTPSIVGDVRYLKSYFIRRIKRICPMYYFLLTAMLLINGREVAWYLNHVLLIQADGIFWSIPQEMLFYLILPFVTAIIWFVLRGSAIAAIAVLAILAALANCFFDDSCFHLRGNSRELPFYIGIFFTGMVVCYFYHCTEEWPLLRKSYAKYVLEVMGICVLLFLVVSAKYFWNSAVTLGWHYSGTFAAMCGFLIFATLHSEGLLLGRIMSSYILRAIGIVSFSMYLIHDKVISFLKMNGFDWGVVLFVASLAITYGLSAVSYGLIERPFLQIEKR